MESHLPAFKENNPQLEVVIEHIRGQHPHLKGLYSKISLAHTHAHINAHSIHNRHIRP